MDEEQDPLSPVQPREDDAVVPSNLLHRRRSCVLLFGVAFLVGIWIQGDARTRTTVLRQHIEDVTSFYAMLEAETTYLCSNNPRGAEGVRRCCSDITIENSGIYRVQNSYRGHASCGLLNCSSGTYDKKDITTCPNFTRNRATVNTFGRYAQTLHTELHTELLKPQPSSDLQVLASRKYYQCPGNPDNGFKTCCSDIGRGDGFFMAQSIYVGQAKCGYLSCPGGEFIGATCRAATLLYENITLQFNTTLNAFSEKTLVRLPSHDTGSRRLQAIFPNPNQLNPLLTPLQRKKIKQAQNALCAASIQAAILYAAGASLQIAGSTTLCAFDGKFDGYEESFCAQAIFSILQDLSFVASYSISASTNCGARNQACGQAVTGMLAAVNSIGVSASRMEIDCGHKLLPYHPGLQNFFSCGGDLAKIAHNIPTFLGGITQAMRVCRAHQEKPPGAGEQDKARCAGDVIATVTYVAAAGLQLSWIEKACVGLDTRNNGYTDSAISCSLIIGSGLAVLATATAQAEQSATSCSGIYTKCAQDATNIAKDVFTLQTTLSNVVQFCRKAEFAVPIGVSKDGEPLYQYPGKKARRLLANDPSIADEQLAFVGSRDALAPTVNGQGLAFPAPSWPDVDPQTRKIQIKDSWCAATVTAMVSALANIAADATKAANDCAPKNQHEKENKCGNDVSGMIAGFARMADTISETTINCEYFMRVAGDTYKCAHNFEQIAQFAYVISAKLASAIISCGFKAFGK